MLRLILQMIMSLISRMHRMHKPHSVVWGMIFMVFLFGFSGCYGGYVMYNDPPPPSRVEVMGDPPSLGCAWINGRWAWHNQWEWQPGRWEAPPAPTATFVHGYWSHGHDGYRYNEGHWHTKTVIERHQEPEPKPVPAKPSPPPEHGRTMPAER
jgi:hypothetical protein